jgi:phosphoglucomutase
VNPAQLNAALFAPTKQVFNFGTAGFRTDDDLAYQQSCPVLTHAVADWVIEKSQKDGKPHSLLLGGDTRDKSRAAMPEIAKILNQRGIDVVLVKDPVPTPVLAHAAQQFKQKGVPQPAGAIVLTASHNPWPFYGLNFLTTDGAVAPNSVSKQFEKRQTEPLNANLDRKAYGLSEKPQTVTHDPYPAYKAHLSKLIDLKKIAQSPLNIIYDPLYATGRRYLPRLLAEHGKPITVLHNTDQRPAGYKGMPEPTADQLTELSAQVKAQGAKKPMTLGMATDGDADRFGIQDETGRFLTPNEVLMLTLHHLTQNKGVKHGVVVRSQATSHALDQLAAQSGMKTVQTPVGMTPLLMQVCGLKVGG